MATLGASYDYLFKYIMIGESSVGKSALLLRFSDGLFTESFLPTIGVDFKIRTIELDKKIIKLQIWDTAGQERFKNVTTTYYKGAHGIILVFDLCDLKSFNEIENWNKEVEKNASPNAIKMLIGNKSDLGDKRVVTQREAQDLAIKLGASQYIETSAKCGTNVEKAFISLASEVKSSGIAENDEKKRKTLQGSTITSEKSNNNQQKKKSCC